MTQNMEGQSKRLKMVLLDTEGAIVDGKKGRVDGGDGGRMFGSTIGKWGCFHSISRLET